MELPAGLGAVVPQAFRVAYDPIVVPVAPVFGGDRLHQVSEFLGPLRPEPFAEPRHRAPQLLAAGAAGDVGLAPRAAFVPAEFKAEEVKPSVVRAPAPSETQHLRFVGGQFQSELRQALWQCLFQRGGATRGVGRLSWCRATL